MDIIDSRPPADDALDLDALDPGIRATARWLRNNGFTVSFAGRGGANDDGEPTPPHVFCNVSPPEMLVAEARRLAQLVDQAQLGLGDDDIVVSASYDHVADVASVALINVHDGMLPWVS
jgi:hypothetical protein